MEGNDWPKTRKIDIKSEQRKGIYDSEMELWRKKYKVSESQEKRKTSKPRVYLDEIVEKKSHKNKGDRPEKEKNN